MVVNAEGKALLRLRHRLTIHPGSRVCPNLTKILPNSLLGNVMDQRRKPKLWLTPSFCCYSFESCCHGWRFFSLHRRPNPPLVWSPCFCRTTHLPLAASPCSRLSRPQSTISQSDFRQVIGSSLPCWLVGPYKLRLNLTALPCSHDVLWSHAGGTNPGSISGHSLYRIQRFGLPRRGIGSTTSITGNIDRLSVFGQRLRRLWWLILRRRSQRQVAWDRLLPIFTRWLPAPRVLHPYPVVRFLATHPRWEPYA